MLKCKTYFVGGKTYPSWFNTTECDYSFLWAQFVQQLLTQICWLTRKICHFFLLSICHLIHKDRASFCSALEILQQKPLALLSRLSQQVLRGEGKEVANDSPNKAQRWKQGNTLLALRSLGFLKPTWGACSSHTLCCHRLRGSLLAPDYEAIYLSL